MEALSFAILFKYAAMVTLICFLLVSASDGCTYKDDCDENQVCCDYECVYGSSCVGHYCSSDSDCSSGESCCGRSCVSSSTCVGHHCSFDSDCSSGESCCSSQCHDRTDCIGLSCSSYGSDCGNFATCCHGTCQNIYDYCVDVAAAVIAGSVIGSLVFICMISMCIFFARRQRRPIQGRVIAPQNVTTTTVSTTRYANLPYQGQAPPLYSYPQGRPYYPLPQSEQQQTTNPPPYNPQRTADSEQPPPYSGEPQAASGGVYAPQPSYGTIPSAPAV